MANVLVDGAVIRVTASPDWSFGSGATLDVTVTGTGSILKKEGKKVVVVGDIDTALGNILQEAYKTTTFTLPGTLDAQSNTPATGSTKLTDSGNKVSLDTDSGSGALVVAAPATNPQSADPVAIKNYTWAIHDHGQGTVILVAV